MSVRLTQQAVVSAVYPTDHLVDVPVRFHSDAKPGDPTDIAYHVIFEFKEMTVQMSTRDLRKLADLGEGRSDSIPQRGGVDMREAATGGIRR